MIGEIRLRHDPASCSQDGVAAAWGCVCAIIDVCEHPYTAHHLV